MHSESNINKPLKIFISYSRTDEDLKNKLVTHLASLEREGLIESWDFRMIVPGDEWDKEIYKELEGADIILLLISPDFIASNYCYDVEVKRALERHQIGDARVIPIILRHVDWIHAPFSKLQALPKDANPITSWSDEDKAFLDVIEGIRRAVNKWKGKKVDHQIEFVNRFDEIRDITKTFYAPFLLISAPKEYGKTRLLEQVISHLEPQHFCVHLRLIKEESYNIRKLAFQILENLGESSSRLLELTETYEIGGMVGLSILRAVMSSSKRKVLILIDKTEAINDPLAKTLLNEFIPAIEEVMNKAKETIPLRIILSGRYRINWKQLSSKIPLTLMILTPFDFDAVHQTTTEFNSQQKTDMDQDYVREFASHLMYFTGGHPGCMANILKSKDFGLPIRTIMSKENIYYDELVHPFIEAIEKDIPHNLRGIFGAISAIRRFNTSLLQWLIDKQLVTWTKPVHDLEDLLLQTYLVNNDEGFLKDEITRRLFAIRFHRNRRDEFINICEESISFYESKLAQSDCYRPDIVAIEILFQLLQVFLCQRRSNAKPFIEKLKGILNRLSTFTASRDIITTVEQRLRQDWEFSFNFSYLFSGYPFSKFMGEISTFRKNLPGG